MNPMVSCRLLDSYQIPPCYSPWALQDAQSSGLDLLHFNSPWAQRHRWGRNTGLSSCSPFLLTLCLSPALGRPGVKLSPPVSCNGNASQTSQIPTEAQTARDWFSIRSYMVGERDHGRVGSLISEFQKEEKGVLGQDPQVYWAQILALLQLTKTDFREVILSPPISVPLLLHADNDPSYIWPWWRLEKCCYNKVQTALSECFASCPQRNLFSPVRSPGPLAEPTPRLPLDTKFPTAAVITYLERALPAPSREQAVYPKQAPLQNAHRRQQ